MASTAKYLDRFVLIAKLDQLEKLIGGAHAFTKGASARDKDCLAVKPTSAKATCWCLTGALAKVSGTSQRQYEHLYDLIAAEVERTARSEYNTLAQWNDAKGRTQTQVVNMVRRTRERLAASA